MSLLYACGRYNNDIRAESAVAVWHAKGQSEGLFLANRMIFFEDMTFFGGQIDSFSSRIEIPLGLRWICFGAPGIFLSVETWTKCHIINDRL